VKRAAAIGVLAIAGVVLLPGAAWAKSKPKIDTSGRYSCSSVAEINNSPIFDPTGAAILTGLLHQSKTSGAHKLGDRLERAGLGAGQLAVIADVAVWCGKHGIPIPPSVPKP
jgi:hypothetical protein